MGRPLKGCLLDSVVLIDHFNGVEAATRFLLDHRGELSISVITRAEVLTGFDAVAEAQARAFLDCFDLPDFFGPFIPGKRLPGGWLKNTAA